MKFLNSLLLGLSMVIPVSVWAAPFGSEDNFLNLYYKNKALYLGQYNKGCTAGDVSEDDGTCAFSQRITDKSSARSAFYNATQSAGKWVSVSEDDVKESELQSTVLNLKTDIDFGQTLDQNGDCSENHSFLPFTGLTFNGNNKTISNLCGVDHGYMDRPFGLFGEISGKTVKNLIISNVYFSVAKYVSGADASKKGGDYRAAGALTYRISNSNVTNVKLKNIVIQAPFAGGLAGYIENSTIAGVTTIDDSFIRISNEREIETGYIGSTIYSSGTNKAVFDPYKVLLGGIAGAAFFSNFKDIDIAVQVENKVEVDSSALGGLVGHYVYAPLSNQFPQVSDRNSKIANVKIHGSSSADAGYINPFITGGTAMGGILGASRRLHENNSPKNELVINNAEVTGLSIKRSKIKIDDLNERYHLHMGGMVGNAELCAAGVLKILNSNVDDVDIYDSIPSSGALRYYVGGAVGFASCFNLDNSGNRSSYLTIQNTTASGNIKLDHGYVEKGKTASKVHVSASIGGLVGDAILSLEDDGLTKNASRVSVVYDVITTPNTTASDTVWVGGIFGCASILGSSVDSVVLKDYSYEGTLSVKDDGIDVRVGGIIGEYPFFTQDAVKIKFNDVHVKGKANSEQNKDNAIVYYEGEKNTSTGKSFVGGVCGICQSPMEISKSSIEGNIVGAFNAGASGPKKSFYTGGLVGYSNVKTAMTVKNNYFIGELSDVFSKSSGIAGYLFGYMTGYGLGTPPVITSNFHYGNDGVGAIGYFNDYGEYSNITYFNELGKKDVINNKFVAKNNVRNGKTMNLQDGENGSVNNGLITEAYMKSENFAGFLNAPWDDVADLVWSSDNTHGKLPYFGDTPVESTVDVVFEDEAESKSQTVKIGEDAVAPTVKPNGEGQCFTGWDPADITKVMTTTTFKAQYGDCNYTVTFYDLNGDPFATDIVNKHGDAANKPKNNPSSTVDGKCFVDWKDDFSNVTGPMDVNAISKTCEYEVTFIDLDGNTLVSPLAKDGNPLDNPQIVKWGEAAVEPEDPNPSGGKCFDHWVEDFTNVTADITVSAYSKDCEYEVVFVGMDEDGNSVSMTQIVTHGSSATEPSTTDFPVKVGGQCFDYWDGDYTNVTGPVTVTAQYEPCKYTVLFVDEDGTTVLKTEKDVVHNHAATPPDDPEAKNGRCFAYWSDDYSQVTGPMTIKAEYEPCRYKVEFVYENGDLIEGFLDVEYGKSVEAPNPPEIPGKCFIGWNSNDYTNVTESLTVVAEYKDCKSSSSSVVVQSSSSRSQSSSSRSETKESSSSTISPKSSSSRRGSHEGPNYQYLYEIAEPKTEQDSNALRIEFDKDKLAEVSGKVDYRIQVLSDAGVYLDTVVEASVIDKAKNGTWRLDPAPVGDYTVTFTLSDGENSVSYDTVFSAPKQKEYVARSWQTLSLSAFCYNQGENCKSSLQERFAERNRHWEAEMCEEMKAEVKRGNAPNDQHFYREMEMACAAAEEADDMNSIYWWDEAHPVGDYWQYRKFDLNDEFDSTRGYWYGPMYKETLTLGLQTPKMDDEIVWHLENKYSGWNLVANPFGWYVKLPKDKDIRFLRWDAVASDYDDEFDVLGPYEAIWVHTDKTRTFRIPLKAAIVLEGENEKKSLKKGSANETWNFRVVLTDDNGKRDSWNELAVGKTASSLGEPPAGMGDRVNLSIVDGKQRLAKSVKKNAADLEWNLEASATSSRNGHLNFVGLESVWAKGLHVYATVDNETVEVVKDRPVDVKLSSNAKNVSIRVTKSAVPLAAAKTISGFHVGQTANVLNVGFDAAAKLAGAKVKVSIVGVDGRVAAMGKAIASEGSNTVSLKKPKQGVYFVKVKVGSQSATTRIMVR